MQCIKCLINLWDILFVIYVFLDIRRIKDGIINFFKLCQF